MNFYIKKIRLWFNNHPKPQDYEFHPNKVNVVTGDSSTGKSSILRIIDYCLMAQESTIVDDVINNNVSWYGLSFHLNGRDYVIARKSPFNGRINQDIYWAMDTDVFPQGSYPRPTPDVKRQDVLHYLNKEFAIPQILMGDNKKKLDLTFRHTLLLNFLTEEIIATANRYLDTLFFDDDDMIDFDSRILKISLGADEKKEAELTEKVKLLDESIKQEEKNKSTDERNRQAYEKKYNAVLEIAKAIGLIDESEVFDSEVVLARIKEAVDHFNLIKRSHAKLDALAELSDKQRKLKVEIDGYKKLKYEYNRAIRYARKVEDSLKPFEYLEKYLNRQVMSEDSIALFASLEEAFTASKKNTLKPDELPQEFEANLQKLKEEYNQVSTKIKENQEAIDYVFDPNMLVRLVTLAEQIKGLVKKDEKYIGDLEYNKLKDQYAANVKDLEIVTKVNENTEKAFLKDVKSYYDDQTGMSASYRNCEVIFDKKNVRLKLQRPDDAYPIRNIGSKSNFMFMYLCFFLGLHQYLCSREHSFVPSFLFIDQPSIPYYGNNSRRRQEAGDLTIAKTDDRSRLEEAFRLINSFMGQNVSEDNDFQIIMVEHADPEYWKDLDYFETRYVFTEDRDYGLIPKYVAE